MQRIEFSYGLPTANLVGGFTIEGTGVLGFDFYGEWDRNRRYFQFPNAALFNEGEEHAVSSEGSDAWYFNVSRNVFPYFLYGEAYAIDEAYSTTAFLVSAHGRRAIRQYPSGTCTSSSMTTTTKTAFPIGFALARPMTGRFFPAWDQNNDFISDFNQNDNATAANIIPDYDEPFSALQRRSAGISLWH